MNSISLIFMKALLCLFFSQRWNQKEKKKIVDFIAQHGKQGHMFFDMGSTQIF